MRFRTSSIQLMVHIALEGDLTPNSIITTAKQYSKAWTPHSFILSATIPTCWCRYVSLECIHKWLHKWLGPESRECPAPFSQWHLKGSHFRLYINTDLPVWTNFQNDLTTKRNVLDERAFARFEFKMSFGQISHIAQCPWRCPGQIITALTHLPLVPNICVRESVNIGSDDGLSPIRRQAII